MLLNSAVFAKDLKYITVWWEERCSEYQQKDVKMKMKSKFQVLYVVIHEQLSIMGLRDASTPKKNSSLLNYF